MSGDDAVTPLVSREVNSVVDEERQIHLLTNEYWSLAARDPELGARYAERQRALRELIAQALVDASKATSLKVPLVVRLEGTNVEQGKQILADSKLPIISAKNMADAAEKVVKAAK